MDQSRSGRCKRRVELATPDQINFCTNCQLTRCTGGDRLRMGIKGFVNYIKAAYPRCLVKYPPGVTRLFLDDLYIDINTIIHRASRRESRGDRLDSAVEAKVMREVGALLKRILRHVTATKLLYLALDGAAPMAKLETQRTRRIANELDSIRNDAFDTQQITPGTLFMGRAERAMAEWAHVHLQKTLERALSTQARVSTSTMTIAIDGASRAGEGEQKITRAIRGSNDNNSNALARTRCIVAGDADVFLYALAWNRPSCYILDFFDRSDSTFRASSSAITEDVGGGKETLASTLQVFSVDRFREEVGSPLDFILICLMGGSDYGPAVNMASYKHLLPFFQYQQPRIVDGEKRVIRVDRLRDFCRAYVDELTGRCTNPPTPSSSTSDASRTAPATITPALDSRLLKLYTDEHRQRAETDPWLLTAQITANLRHLQWGLEMVITGRGSAIHHFEPVEGQKQVRVKRPDGTTGPYRISLISIAALSDDQVGQIQKQLSRDSETIADPERSVEGEPLSAAIAAIMLLKSCSPELIPRFLPASLVPIHARHASGDLQSYVDVREALKATPISPEDLYYIQKRPIALVSLKGTGFQQQSLPDTTTCSDPTWALRKITSTGTADSVMRQLSVRGANSAIATRIINLRHQQNTSH